MKKHILFPLTLFIFCTLLGCRSAKQAAQLVREVHTDTMYINKVHYDSIFVSRDRTTDRSRDTIYIKDSAVEYRYRFLRDTLYRTRIDSIPILREVEVIREVPRPKTWFDRLCRYAFFLLCGVLLFFVYRCIRKFI